MTRTRKSIERSVWERGLRLVRPAFVLLQLMLLLLAAYREVAPRLAGRESTSDAPAPAGREGEEEGADAPTGRA